MLAASPLRAELQPAVEAGGKPIAPVAKHLVVRVDARTGKLVRVSAAALAVSRPRDLSKERQEFNALVEQASRAHSMDPLLVDSVIQVESNYNPHAVSSKGAEGLMQLIPSTARQYGVQNSFDPEQNIEGGIRYLKYLQSLFSDERLVLAAYNAGEGAVSKYGWIPPYAETQDYVYKVGRYYGLARRQQTQAPLVIAPALKPTPLAPVLQEFVDGEGRIHITLRQANE